MQSVKQILAELGFNPEAPLESQKAFFKHLVKVAEQLKPPHTNQAEKLSTCETRQEPVQLEFDLPKGKRVS